MLQFPHRLTMKKTFFYNFFPTKEEEETAKASNSKHQVSRTLIEIRDIYPPPVIDPRNPWQIRKVLNPTEVMAGKLLLSHNDAFEYVFRYWSMEMANNVVLGNKCFVALVDFSDETNPTRYQGDGIYMERGPNDCYIIGWMDLVRNRLPNAGDEIGLYWDIRTGTFHVKFFARNA